ncbi:MAG: CpaF family protein [Nitrospirae bacterium]|nr:CpaF family protein [Nitrospirota bacterium]
MSLKDRLMGIKRSEDTAREAAKKEDGSSTLILKRPVQTDPYQELKARIHRKLVERLDLSALNDIGRDRLEEEIKLITEDLINEEGVPLSGTDRDRLLMEILHETLGLGPLEPLLHDMDITDILVNGPGSVYIEKFGKLEKTNTVFRNDAHLMQIIDRIISKVGRRIDEASPYVDARLPDGSRVNAIIPPIALDGPSISIRRFGKEYLTMSDLLSFGSLSPQAAEVLTGAVKARINMIISGGTGSGKTTMLNILSEGIPSRERIVTIEDSAELHLKQDHVVRLETRPPNIEGRGEVTQRNLVKNSLRMRPDRIIVGEVRGEEALDMLQAMNTGHDGSISTVHANSPRDALSRLETMVLMAGMDLPQRAIREQIASAIGIVVQLARLSDGARKVVGVSEIVGMEGDVISMQEIFHYHISGVNEEGKVLGEFKSNGIWPKFADRLAKAGIHLSPKTFEI